MITPIWGRDPIFKHECKNCKLIGRALSREGNPGDVYVCIRDDHSATFVLRDIDADENPGGYYSNSASHTCLVGLAGIHAKDYLDCLKELGYCVVMPEGLVYLKKELFPG